MGTVVFQEGFNLRIRTREKGHQHLPHCHAVGHGCEARITLETFDVLSNAGFSKNDMRKILAAVRHYQKELMDKWKEYHDEEQG
jgi:Domain of unknown function (DUF4160)